MVLLFPYEIAPKPFSTAAPVLRIKVGRTAFKLSFRNQVITEQVNVLHPEDSITCKSCSMDGISSLLWSGY